MAVSGLNQYSHNPVIGSHFEGVFEIVIGHGRPSDHRLRPRYFGDSASAAQFVRSLGADEYRWASILGESLNHTDPNLHISQRVAALVCRNGVSFYEIPRVERAKPVVLESGKQRGKGLVFAPAIAGRSRNAAEKIPLQNTAEAEALVNSLNNDQVYQAMTSLGLVQSASSQSTNKFAAEAARKGLVAELASGKVSVWEVKPQTASRANSAPTEPEVVSSRNAPGNRKAPLAPEPEQASPAPQPAKTAPASAEADQVQAIEKAAEEGTPFCEECAQESH